MVPGKCICAKCEFAMDAPLDVDCCMIKCPECGSVMMPSDRVFYPLK